MKGRVITCNLQKVRAEFRNRFGIRMLEATADHVCVCATKHNSYWFEAVLTVMVEEQIARITYSVATIKQYVYALANKDGIMKS